MFFAAPGPFLFYQKDQLWDILKAGEAAAFCLVDPPNPPVWSTDGAVDMGILGVKNHGSFNTQTVVHELDDLGVPGLVKHNYGKPPF